MPGNLNDSNQNTLLGLSNSFQDNKDLENANSISRRFISYRPRSEAELRIRLLKVFSHEIVLESVAQMYREGLLNDQRFAQMWVDSRQQSRPKSKNSIKRELLSKGISEHLAEEAISQLSDIDNATLCANKKARSLNGLGKDDFYKKLFTKERIQFFYLTYGYIRSVGPQSIFFSKHRRRNQSIIISIICPVLRRYWR